MDFSDIKPLITTYHRKIMTTNLSFKRYLYYKINWNVRLLGIRGARGVGKTTLILQYIKEISIILMMLFMFHWIIFGLTIISWKT